MPHVLPVLSMTVYTMFSNFSHVLDEMSAYAFDFWRGECHWSLKNHLKTGLTFGNIPFLLLSL